MKTSLRAVLAFAVVACFAASASAVSITTTSAPFSIGYGFSAAGGGIGGWSTNETVGSNTATTQGDFSFTPVVTGGQFDGSGPGFPSRVLTSSVGFTGVNIAYPSQAGFEAVVTGTYSGALPFGENYRVRLNINQVSIYGVTTSSFAGSGDMAFVETTPGNGATSPAITVVVTGAYATASNYTQLVWDPADFEELGLTSTRSFVLTSDNLRGIDGFEIFGTVDFIYDLTPAPEPSTLVLLGISLVGFSKISRRRRAGYAQA